IEAALGDAEDPAQGADGEGHLLRGDEGELHSLSFAKKVAAAFKMSRSIVSRLFSRRSRASSSRSAVVRAPGGPFPASVSARLTHSRSAVSVKSKSTATCVMVRSPTLQSRTASALNSGVNARRGRRFFFLSMVHSRRIL